MCTKKGYEDKFNSPRLDRGVVYYEKNTLDDKVFTCGYL